MPQIYCAICGGPILSVNCPSPNAWLNEATLLTSAHETENGVELDMYYPHNGLDHPWSYHLMQDPPNEDQRSVLRLDAYPEEDSYFILAESDTVVSALSVKVEYRPPPPARTECGPIYLPVHRHCLQMADYFVQSIDTSMHTFPREYNGKITSIRQLWEVLYRRLDGRILAHEYVLKEPHDYYGGGLPGQVEWEWEPEYDDPYGELLEQSPVGIPNLTESILQNLEPIPTDLPTNLTRNIQDTDDLQWANNLQNAELICNYTYSQDWWCEAVINKSMFPWLWDIDTHMIRERQKTGNWNWELLARQLSQIVIHDPVDKTLNLPLRLRNRRRIWRILEEGRIGDVAEPEDRETEKRLEEQSKWWTEERAMRVLNTPIPDPGFGPFWKANPKVPKAEVEKFS